MCRPGSDAHPRSGRLRDRARRNPGARANRSCRRALSPAQCPQRHQEFRRWFRRDGGDPRRP
nr:MAG TPA: hypothetical protein [Caudoviricetes sp.]